ncbi:MAG TPA: hypothetical protein VGQ95_12825 [Chthoniobacterales bacterium]|nr:hypothetical protein [Chthoniobacterales bacterium]
MTDFFTRANHPALSALRMDAGVLIILRDSDGGLLFAGLGGSITGSFRGVIGGADSLGTLTADSKRSAELVDISAGVVSAGRLEGSTGGGFGGRAGGSTVAVAETTGVSTGSGFLSIVAGDVSI